MVYVAEIPVDSTVTAVFGFGNCVGPLGNIATFLDFNLILDLRSQNAFGSTIRFQPSQFTSESNVENIR